MTWSLLVEYNVEDEISPVTATIFGVIALRPVPKVIVKVVRICALAIKLVTSTKVASRRLESKPSNLSNEHIRLI